MAVGGLILCASIGYPLAGVGVVLGLGLGALNTLSMRSMVGRAEPGSPKRQVVGSSLRRLALVTVAVFALLVLQRQIGFGALFGLLVFQMVVMSSFFGAVIRQLKVQAGQ